MNFKGVRRKKLSTRLPSRKHSITSEALSALIQSVIGEGGYASRNEFWILVGKKLAISGAAAYLLAKARGVHLIDVPKGYTNKLSVVEPERVESMRKKLMIDREKLVAAIAEVEGGRKPPKSRAELYDKVALKLDVPVGSVKGRIEDYGLVCKTPERKSGGSPPSEPIQYIDVGKNEGLDLTPFTSRGIVVNTLADLCRSSAKSDSLNQAILDGWLEVREKYNCPYLRTPPKS